MLDNPREKDVNAYFQAGHVNPLCQPAAGYRGEAKAGNSGSGDVTHRLPCSRPRQHALLAAAAGSHLFSHRLASISVRGEREFLRLGKFRLEFYSFYAILF